MGPFLELHECPLAVRLVLGPITSSQNATTITIKTRMFTFAPHFFDCGAKLWNVLALTHAKTLGPTKFFSTVTHSMRSYVKTYTTYLWMEWFLWPVHFEICQIIQERPTLPYLFMQAPPPSSHSANQDRYTMTGEDRPREFRGHLLVGFIIEWHRVKSQKGGLFTLYKPLRCTYNPNVGLFTM